MANNVNRDFRAVVERAGFVDESGKSIYTMHDVRLSFVTNLFATGEDPKLVQELAGRADIGTTMKYYSAVRTKQQAPAIDRLSQYVSHTA